MNLRAVGTELIALARLLARPRHYSSAVSTLAFVLVVIVVTGTLVVLGHATQTSKGFADSREFLTWAGLGGLSAAVWAVATIAGLAHLDELTGGRRRRDRPAIRRRIRRYAGCAIALAAVVLALLVLLGEGGGFDVELSIWWLLRGVIPTVGLAAAVPWIVTVWWTHDDLTALKKRIGRVPARTASSGELPVFPVRRLLASWTSIERSTAALTCIVAVGILTTGALRLAVIADRAQQEDRGIASDDLPQAPSESDVLAYGLFFAVLVAAVVVPLLLSYRRRARQLSTTLYPPEGRMTTADSVATLENLLHVSSGSLLSPWALIGILAPVGSSALAVYLPGLAG